MNKNYIIIALVAVVLILSFLLYQRQDKNSEQGEVVATPVFSDEAVSPVLIGGEKDEHGCLVAAGYSWCEIKNKCLRMWEEKCDDVASAVPSVETEENLLKIIKELLIAKHGANANSLNVTVSGNSGVYAKGGASGEGGGGIWFAAKVNNEWKLIWDGNGIILCSDIDKYPDFPTEFLSECFDDKTEKTRKR